MPALTDENKKIFKVADLRRSRYNRRNEYIKRWYELYFQVDQYGEAGQESLATPDSRSAIDLGIYILSRNPHIDRVPFTVQDQTQRQRMNQAERFLAGMWRVIDHRELLRGKSGHQRSLASWMLMCGWYAGFVAIVPDLKGYPKAIADLWDPTGVYPEWGGVDGFLTGVEHEYVYTLGGIRDMAFSNDWTAGTSLKGDDDASVRVLDHWESRYNKLNPEQPDILNAVFVTVNSQSSSYTGTPISLSAGTGAQAWIELQPLTNRTAKNSGGFTEIPVLVGPVGGIEVGSAYFTDVHDIMASQGQGLLAPVEHTQDAMNRHLTIIMQEIADARLSESTYFIRSSSGRETFEPDQKGGNVPIGQDVDISKPLAFRPKLAESGFILQLLMDSFQRSTFSWTNFGQSSFSLSGIAIERLNESARSHLGPGQYMMQHFYQQAGFVFLRDYMRRWNGKKKFGRVQLQGLVGRAGMDSGFFDEEFTPDIMPTTTFVHSEIILSLAEDDMMKANIARTLNPSAELLSPTWIREHVLKVQDEGLEARRVAEDKIEQAPFYVNVQIMNRLVEEILAERDVGNVEKATFLTLALRSLMASLAPQQGQGIPERPSTQGPPEAGGNLTNAGGGRPELAPENRMPVPGVVEAAAGPGAQAQAERNAR